MLAHGGDMLRQITTRKNTCMDFGVEGFYAAIEHFWKAGEIGDIDHRQARVANRFGRPPCGQKLNPYFD